MGSRPGFASCAAPLLKSLSFNHIRVIQASANIFNNDLSACYNRVLAHLALLCCSRLGQPDDAIDFILLFLLSAKYHVETAHGISQSFYSNTMKVILAFCKAVVLLQLSG